MIQREVHYYARKFLDEAPTHSLSSVMVSVEEGYACLKVSDGHGTATIDFFFRDADEAVQADKKLEAMRSLLRDFCQKLSVELATKIPHTEGSTAVPR